MVFVYIKHPFNVGSIQLLYCAIHFLDKRQIHYSPNLLLPARIIGLVDTVGLKLVVQGDTETILSDSVALAVKKVDGTDFQGTSFSITDPSNVQV